MPIPASQRRLLVFAVSLTALLTLWLSLSPFPPPDHRAHSHAPDSADPSGPTGTQQSPTPASLSDAVGRAVQKATKGGLAGMLAGALQVLAFMWLRTVMNQQYVNGGAFADTLLQLWGEGGISRFYKGVEYAIVQAPLTRFGDTFMNTAAVVLCAQYFPQANTAVVTMVGSVASSAFRILITPIDTLKTTRQVHGDAAYNLLLTKVRQRGVRELFAGWEANFAASWAGTYPWFFVFNWLNGAWPKEGWVGPYRHVRNGSIGMCATAASDIVSNALRVLKTIRQTHPDSSIGYFEAAREVVAKEGYTGLLGRGLGTRLFVNVLQGVFFTVVWRALSE